MFLRRCAFAAFCLVLVLFVLRQPENAADTTKTIGHALTTAADALNRFVSALQ